MLDLTSGFSGLGKDNCKIRLETFKFQFGAIYIIGFGGMMRLPASSLDSMTSFANVIIRSSDNDSSSFWPPGSLRTLGADGHI